MSFAPGRSEHVAMRDRRIASIDVLRGFVMALMALDHARAFLMGFTPDPTDLAATTPALFLTRWITHLCAPGFLLLAGISARLQLERRGPAALGLFLATRGVWLIVLELTIIGFAWVPDPTRSLLMVQVIWAIGCSMLLLAPLVCLPAALTGAIGCAVMALHPVVSAALAKAGAPVWLSAVLIDANATIQLGEGTRVIVSYPILPWFGVLAAGYGLGELIVRQHEGWPRQLERIGWALLVAVVFLRASGLGLDPQPWRTDLAGWRWALSFLNCAKYPPSPLFLLMTLGLLLVLLGRIERQGKGPLANALRPLGEAPLFFYALHLYALRILGLAAAVAVWGSDQIGPPPLPSTPEWSLATAWLVWALVMPALFLPTRWFARFKQRKRRWWTSYL